MKTGFPMLEWIWRKLPFLVIGLAYIWALNTVGLRFVGKELEHKTTIRIAHWQLEAGVREGLDEAAAEFERLHPGVKVLQEAIPENGYGQWLSVQLLGGTAPDIVEMGAVPHNLLTMFYQRYILSLTPYVGRPNPYNQGTELENTPLINTFLDGLRKSFIDETQEYMTIPLARMGVRLFYNKDLYQKLTGRSEPPRQFREFIEVCQQVQKIQAPSGIAYTPIAGSRYHLQGWNQSLFLPATHGAFRSFDFNHDGRVGSDEWALGFQNGKISFDNPSYRGAFRLLREFTKYFQPGWIGLTRDEAIFNFAQEKAVFISSGLWELGGIEQLADGRFELGVMDFPLPAADDPEFGGLIEGPRYENPGGFVAFAVTKTSRNPDLAVDFLLFLASRKQNEKFAERLRWLPIIEGAKSAPGLEVFEPTLQGVFPAFFPALGGESVIKWEQLEALLLVDQISYDEVARDYSAFYQQKGPEDFAEYLRNIIRGQRRHAQTAASVRVKALQGNEADWQRYRDIALRPVGSDVSAKYYEKLNAHPEQEAVRYLYQYSPAAQKRLREENGPEGKGS